MAGRARFNALKAELDLRTTDYFGDDEPPRSALDYVCARVENGTTTKALALEITTGHPFEVTYARLLAHLTERFGEAATTAALDAARARASHCLVEEGLELVDGVPADNQAAISKAAQQARQRNWMAERYNRARYGSDKGVNVSISVGALHLDALRAVSARVTVSQPAQITDGNSQPATLPDAS